MDGIEYLIELCELLPRCGPGDMEHTQKAFHAIPQIPQQSSILDIGCGTGAQTLDLAKICNGNIIAIDIHQPFLDILQEQVVNLGLNNRIVPQNMSMLEMNFEDNSFDIIWSEGALYFMGFQNGLNRCRELLKNNGYLAVSELVYTHPDPPETVVQFLENEYPDITSIDENIKLIDAAGFKLITHFTLPDSAWIENYYLPMEKELPGLKRKYKGNTVAQDIFDSFTSEINYFRKYSRYYGYEFFIMQKEL